MRFLGIRDKGHRFQKLKSNLEHLQSQVNKIERDQTQTLPKQMQALNKAKLLAYKKINELYQQRLGTKALLQTTFTFKIEHDAETNTLLVTKEQLKAAVQAVRCQPNCPENSKEIAKRVWTELTGQEPPSDLDSDIAFRIREWEIEDETTIPAQGKTPHETFGHYNYRTFLAKRKIKLKNQKRCPIS